MGKKVMAGIAAFIIVFGVVAYMIFQDGSISHYQTQDYQNDGSAQEHLKISAADLWLAYQNSVEEADAKYKGKTVVITGEVIGVSEFMYDLCIELSAPCDYYAGIECRFDGLDALDTPPEIGSTVSIVGTCEGIFPGVLVWRDESIPENTSFVWVKDCDLVP